MLLGFGSETGYAVVPELLGIPRGELVESTRLMGQGVPGGGAGAVGDRTTGR